MDTKRPYKDYSGNFTASGRPFARTNDAEILERLAMLEDLEDPSVFGYQEMRKLYSMLANNNPKVAMYGQRVIELEADIIAAETKERAEDAV